MPMCIWVFQSWKQKWKVTKNKNTIWSSNPTGEYIFKENEMWIKEMSAYIYVYAYMDVLYVCMYMYVYEWVGVIAGS